MWQTNCPSSILKLQLFPYYWFCQRLLTFRHTSTPQIGKSSLVTRIGRIRCRKLVKQPGTLKYCLTVWHTTSTNAINVSIVHSLSAEELWIKNARKNIIESTRNGPHACACILKLVSNFNILPFSILYANANRKRLAISNFFNFNTPKTVILISKSI